uniref:Uncharacterized protein n=1 Tax=uncultured bacterium contig00078 TaxID=1181556 RepID=A0A806K1V4_9BACT|nr:hypothetical protein [uncultured bacterium contig00078]
MAPTIVGPRSTVIVFNGIVKTGGNASEGIDSVGTKSF